MPPSHPCTPTHEHAIKKEPSPPLSQHSSPPSQQEYFTKPISEDVGRPKREIHCPSKDYPETYTTRHVQDTSMKFCTAALKEMKKAKYRHLAYAFLQPVDPVALNIPDYFSIVKRPMDLSTIANKLLNNAYKSPDEFEADVTLMFDNCYLYNPPSLPIYSMAKDLQSVFKKKWESRPPPVKKNAKHPHEVTDDRDSKIAELERHLATITQQIESMKGTPKKKAAPARRPSAPPVKRKRVVKKRVKSEDEEDEFSFEQKKELSELINNLSGDRLDTVVSIIQSSMPNLGGNGQEEIVLDIDALDKETLRKLSTFVNLPNHKKRQRTSTEKLRELNHTLKKFTSNNYESSSSESESGDDDGTSSS